MSTMHPDQAEALGMVGSRRHDGPDPETVDGTMTVDPASRPPLVLGDRDYKSVTDTICGWIEDRTPPWWIPAFAVSNVLAVLGTVMIIYLIITGVGVWGLNNPV